MQLGRREKTSFPDWYKTYRLIRSHGRCYGIPPSADAEEILQAGTLFEHPAVLTAATLPELQELIDAFDEESVKPAVVGRHEGYDLVRLGGALYGVPSAATPGDLNLPGERRRVGAIPAASAEELESAIRKTEAAVPVEFAGWLPVYELVGNCGQHPQFLHTNAPPPGYRFTWSAPPVSHRPSFWARASRRILETAGRVVARLKVVPRIFAAFFRPRRGVSLRARLRIFLAMVRLVGVLVARGCKLGAIVQFLQSRHLQSQLLLGDHPGPVMLASIPFTYGQGPWLIEVEDPTTLFYPLIRNGHTADVQVSASPFFPIIKALLEADHCKAILTHMQSTARMISTLFDSQTIREKVVCAPLGVPLPGRWQRHEPQAEDEPLHLLFINSWSQIPANFYFRGGLDILEAFATLRIRYPQLRLTLRTHLPPLDDHYRQILEAGWVRVIDRFLSAEQMSELHASSHIYLLPAARIHIVSLLQALAHGLAVVASDGWGMEEYVTHERNGLIVKGRYGKVSWADEQAGFLREDYGPMYTSDPQVVEGLVEAVSRLVEDRNLRRRLGENARRDVQTTFSLERWNQGLKVALDRAHGVTQDCLASVDPSENVLFRRGAPVRKRSGKVAS